jgi:hypothetical protein
MEMGQLRLEMRLTNFNMKKSILLRLESEFNQYISLGKKYILRLEKYVNEMDN